MNLRLRDEAAFFAEYQNEPIVESEGEDMLTAEEIAAKVNGYAKGVLPLGASSGQCFVGPKGRDRAAGRNIISKSSHHLNSPIGPNSNMASRLRTCNSSHSQVFSV